MAKLREEPTIYGFYILQNSIAVHDCGLSEVQQLLNVVSNIFNNEFKGFHKYFFINQARCPKLINLEKLETITIINEKLGEANDAMGMQKCCLLYTSPSPRD